MTCSNCNDTPKDSDYLAVTRNNEVVGIICSACQNSVLVLKLVFKREDVKQNFVFEQYLPVACAR